MPAAVYVEPYDPSWPGRFVRERELLQAVLGQTSCTGSANPARGCGPTTCTSSRFGARFGTSVSFSVTRSAATLRSRSSTSVSSSNSRRDIGTTGRRTPKQKRRSSRVYCPCKAHAEALASMAAVVSYLCAVSSLAFRLERFEPTVRDSQQTFAIQFIDALASAFFDAYEAGALE
jgi:GrpB-like predicted nucleotidyltransferase (UPF0157 family)